MSGLSLAARITLIILVAILSAWLLLLTRTYQVNETGRLLSPDPDRLAALVAFAERLPAEDRSALVGAVSSPEMRLSLREAPPASAAVDDVALHEAYASALAGRPVAVAQVSARGPRWVRALLGIDGFHARVAVGLASGETLVAEAVPSIAITRFGVPVGLAAGLVGTLIALLALLVLQHELRPLRRLAAAADALDLTRELAPFPMPRTSAPELRSLVNAYNRLQERLATLMRARMAMMGGISHDVRTFATRLRLRLERLEGPERERALHDIEDMVKLLDDALLASRAGAGELTEELVDVAAFCRSEVDDRRAAGASVTVGIAAADALVLADPLALRRILANLLDNAFAYGGAAHVTVEATAATVDIVIDDDGPGISPARRALMLEPFVRADPSRSRETGGAGLGLAVVHSLVAAHGGTFDIGDAPGGGARMRVRLERFRPDAERAPSTMRSAAA